MVCPFTDRIRYRQIPSGFQSPFPNVTDTEEMSPLKLVPARRRAQDARGHEAERPRPGRPQNRKNGPQAQAQPRTQSRLQPREKAQEKAQRRAPAASSGEIPPEGERLNKHLARTGVCSRREADDWIAQGWVRINGRPVEMGQKVMPGDVVEVRQAARARQQDKVTWDASKGDGGTFKFTPVQANGDALAKGGDEQTITINEASAPVQAKPAPTYDANKTVDVAHDATDAKIAKEVFEGTNSANKPEAVKATGFAAGALKVDGNVITDGALIKAADFDKVTWDASKGEGGTFKFTPVQANGDALQGATEQTITINEAPAPVVNAEPKLGVYPTEAVKFDVAHDALKGALTKDSQTSPFAGTDAEKAPDAVKIVSVQGPDGENTHANIMTLGDGGSARNLTAGQFIDKADFSKVQWDASVDHGSGTYKVQFVPVTSDHQEIAGAQTQTFTVKEAAEQPNYSGTTFSAEAEHNGDATFGKAMFDGSDAAKAPMFIRITEISPSNAEAGDHRVLHLVGDHAQDLKVDDSHPENTVLSAAQFENLRWDASHNGGGSFKFTALDGDMKPIDSSVVHTVTVTEKDAPLAINPQSLFGASEGQGPLTISAKSLAAYTPAEPSSNLLDDLHNQINPLI